MVPAARNFASIEGDNFAVMGLPVIRMLGFIERFGWRYGFGS